MKIKDTYKFVFIIPQQNYSVAIEAESKMAAIEIFNQEYPKLFNMDFNIMRIGREINIDKTENEYLYL